MGYMLDTASNWKACSANIPAGYEVAAVVESIIYDGGWSYTEVEATAEEGVAIYDRRIITEIIASRGLDCTAVDCEAALLAECRRRVTEARAARVAAGDDE